MGYREKVGWDIEKVGWDIEKVGWNIERRLDGI